MKSDFILAITQLSAEKNLPKELLSPLSKRRWLRLIAKMPLR